MKTLIRFGKYEFGSRSLVTDSSKDMIVDDFVLRDSICVGDTIHQVNQIVTLIGHPEAQTMVLVHETSVCAAKQP